MKINLEKGKAEMLKLTRKDKRSLLEKEVHSLLTKLSTMDSASEEYGKVLRHLETLQTCLTDEKKVKSEYVISPDTIAIIAGNLLGIALILSFEKANVLTTKAIGFVLRGRV